MYFAILSQYTNLKKLRTFKEKVLWKNLAIKKLRTFCNSVWSIFFTGQTISNHLGLTAPKRQGWKRMTKLMNALIITLFVKQPLVGYSDGLWFLVIQGSPEVLSVLYPGCIGLRRRAAISWYIPYGGGWHCCGTEHWGFRKASGRYVHL